MPTSKASSNEDNEGWHIKLVKMFDIPYSKSSVVVKLKISHHAMIISM